MSLINFQDHKEKRKFKRIITDLNEILLLLSASQQKLAQYKQYKAVLEIISIIETNKTFFEMYKKRYTKEIEDNNSVTKL